ncbi:MAG: hypothetical protein HUU35_11085 [Armatimonadetes bacterium]|nr:hypothetical protein [Armatimonadota bacterium]
MYALMPAKVFVLDRVRDDPRCLARLERMLGALGNQPEVAWITDENLPERVEELRHLWPQAASPPGVPRPWLRPLIFNTVDLRSRRPDLNPLLARCPQGTSLGDLHRIYGYLPLAIDQHPHQRDRAENCVCWPTYNFGTMRGCPHGCHYCGEGRTGGSIAIGLNLEDYMEKVVAPIIEYNPWNRVFRMILDAADLMAFEPEYGLFDLFTRTLARYPDRYGHFHTASSNVEWLADLPHRDRLVGVWSTTCEGVAQAFEPGTGHAVDRIVAARKCQEMGIPVRFKFKPIIPIANWREEYATILKEAVTLCQPESIGFCLYIWNSFESMGRALDLDRLDPACVAAAREAAETMGNARTRPFPHETRKEIYRHMIAEVRRWDPEVLLYISTESREMWDELKDELGQDPRSYLCGCSSVALPGRKLGTSPGLRNSTYCATPV